MNLLKDVPAGTKKEMNVIIENPKGSNNKYELDKKLNMIVLDRVMHSAFTFPADYGFIPQTHCDDGDPLDAFVIIDQPLHTGVLVKCRPIGILEMIDDGEQDNKLICVPVDDPNYAHVKSLKDISPFFIKKVKHYLEHYKDLKNKKVEIISIKGVSEAEKEFEKSVECFKKL